MFIVMHRDFAARSERNRQHSADRPQNNRPDHETADDHDLKRIKRQEGEEYRVEMKRIAEDLGLHDVLKNEIHKLRNEWKEKRKKLWGKEWRG